MRVLVWPGVDQLEALSAVLSFLPPEEIELVQDSALSYGNLVLLVGEHEAGGVVLRDDQGIEDQKGAVKPLFEVHPDLVVVRIKTGSLYLRYRPNGDGSVSTEIHAVRSR